MPPLQPPPPQFAARRAAQRAARRRRRQQLTLTALLAVVIVAAVVVAVAGGSGSSSKAPTAGTASTSGAATVHRHHRRATSSASASAGTAEIAKLARYGLPVYCAGPRGNELAFTFDDGPGPYTHFAVSKLRAAGERGTFFAVGRSINNFPGWLRREMPVAAIEDHSYTHPVLTEYSADAIQSEIQRTADLITAQTGARPLLFRPPYGSRNPTVDGIVHKLGMLEIIWNVDSADSLGANYAGITQNVEAGMHPGAIILMHENRGQTIRALTALLPELHRRHLRSVSLPELLASDPPSLAQLRAGGNGCSSHVQHGSGG